MQNQVLSPDTMARIITVPQEYGVRTEAYARYMNRLCYQGEKHANIINHRPNKNIRS